MTLYLNPQGYTVLDLFSLYRGVNGSSVGVIFICTAMRVVNLELLASLDTDKIINAEVRFPAR